MNSLLNGHGKIQGITSVYAQRSGEVFLWTRNNGKVEVIKDNFKPFILITDDLMDEGLPYCEIQELEGSLDYKWKVNIHHYKLFEREFLKRYNSLFNTDHKNMGQFEGVKQFNMIEQYLIQSGNTYYKGLGFDDVVRMQIDIETTGTLDESNAKIFMIAIKSSCGFEKVLHGIDERCILNQLNYLIRKIDPDIIENHYIFGFDLPFILRRAEILNVNMQFGRLTGKPFQNKDFYKYGGVTSPFERQSVFGREIIDTIHSSKKYDADTGELEGNYSLKEIAKKLGVCREGDKLYIDGSEIWSTYQIDPKRVADYALWDVREVDGISRKLNQSRFFLAKMIPMSFEKLCTVGSSKIVELPMVRNYLHLGHSLPKPKTLEGATVNSGGLCDIYQSGLFQNVIKLDVKSMYPSIILGNHIGPHQDPLNLFLPFLKSITEQRLEYKEKAKIDPTFGPIQSALKIVINSSYGYLGFKYGMFNNPDGAAKVTEIGRDIALKIKKGIEKHGGSPIEVDTDGIVCKFPYDKYSPSEFNGLVQSELSQYSYIEIEPEPSNGVIESLYMYKEKNYAYLENGKMKIIGSAFKNRSAPKLFKEFVKEGLNLILNNDLEAFEELYERTENRVINGDIRIDEISRNMKIGNSLEDYIELKKKPYPQYEVWVQEGFTTMPKDTITSFYKSNGEYKYRLASKYNGDCDVNYYLKSLATKKSLFDKAFL